MPHRAFGERADLIVWRRVGISVPDFGYEILVGTWRYVDPGDPRIMMLAERMVREGYFDNDLDARRAAKRLVQEVDQMSAESKASSAAPDAQERDGHT